MTAFNIPAAAGAVAGTAAAGILGTVLIIPVAMTVLGAIGFTSAGVAAGSAAAAIQSSVYGGAVGAGSLFATAQSLAMGGAVAGTAQAVGGTAAAAGVAMARLLRSSAGDGDHQRGSLAAMS